MSGRPKRGKQLEYNKLLDAFDAGRKGFAECVRYLVSCGFSPSQANNGVHVYRKGGGTEANLRLSSHKRTGLLDSINAVAKPPKECVNYLMTLGYTYRQATSAVYKYRQERGLIGTKLV